MPLYTIRLTIFHWFLWVRRRKYVVTQKRDCVQMSAQNGKGRQIEYVFGLKHKIILTWYEAHIIKTYLYK